MDVSVQSACRKFIVEEKNARFLDRSAATDRAGDGGVTAEAMAASGGIGLFTAAMEVFSNVWD